MIDRHGSGGIAVFVSLVLLLAATILPGAAHAESAEVRNRRTSAKLEPAGASYHTKVVLNEAVRGQFIVDTGATSTIISTKIAKKLGIRTNEGQEFPVRIADGTVVSGRVVMLDEIRVGNATVFDSSAIILENIEDTGFDGLLGMSFLGHFTFKIDHEANKLFLYE